MIAARQTFVFSKAHALAKRIPMEQDKRQAAHTVCERLVALLTLNKSPRPSVDFNARELVPSHATTATEPSSCQSKGTPATLSLAGTFEPDVSLGRGGSA